MIITIEANLTDEQALILAKEKWYSEMIQNTTISEEIIIIDWVETTEARQVIQEITNPDSPFEFLKRVYEAMIISDATKYFIEVENKKLREQQVVIENAIKDNITNAVTSNLK